VTTWAGVDVGGRRKGFDLALVSDSRLEAGPARVTAVEDVAAWLAERSPRVIAVDSPRAAAPTGKQSRECERDLVKAGVCGIRYTPDQPTMQAHRTGYYDWILNGLDLYDALEDSGSTGWRVIECFPTATWTRLGGKRGTRRRARWTRDLLPVLMLDGLPPVMNQDGRDAIVAGLTARLYDEGATESFGEIVVPSS
jgi:predicted nuclease with RNAse H fold